MYLRQHYLTLDLTLETISVRPGWTVNLSSFQPLTSITSAVVLSRMIMLAIFSGAQII
jgi:hypothetical protein